MGKKKMVIEVRVLSKLKPYPDNARINTPEDDAQLNTSIKKFGLVELIVVNKRSGYIVGGHARAKELKKLGYKEAECVIVDLDPEGERELNIRLNANVGSWDQSIILTKWNIQKVYNYGLKQVYDWVKSGAGFIPSFNPEKSSHEITADDIKNKADKMKAYVVYKENTKTVVCPHCLTEFEIDEKNSKKH